MPKKKKEDNRSENWATTVYLDSAPDNWEEIVRSLYIPCFISPYHDRDVNDDGTPKKPHYHVQFCFESKKSREQVKEITDLFNGVGQEKLRSRSGYCRYLIHRDNPEKAQYNYSEIKVVGNLDLEKTFGSEYNKYQCIKEMRQFCKDNGIMFYADLFDYAAEHHFDDWYKVLCDSGTYVMDRYIKSLQYKVMNQRFEKVQEEGIEASERYKEYTELKIRELRESLKD